MMKAHATFFRLLVATTFITLPCSSFFVSAAEDIDNVTMKVATTEAKRGHRILMHSRDTILNYMLKNGDITLEEIESKKTNRIADRKELINLKKSGDIEAFKTKLGELKTKHQSQREALKSYISEHDELRQSLQEQKKEQRESLKERRREQRNENKEERRNNKKERKNG